MKVDTPPFMPEFQTLVCSWLSLTRLINLLPSGVCPTICCSSAKSLLPTTDLVLFVACFNNAFTRARSDFSEEESDESVSFKNPLKSPVKFFMSAAILAWARSINALTPVSDFGSMSLRSNFLPCALPCLAKESSRCAKVAWDALSPKLAGLPETNLEPPITACAAPALVLPNAKLSIALSSTSFCVYSPPLEAAPAMDTPS